MINNAINLYRRGMKTKKKQRKKEGKKERKKERNWVLGDTRLFWHNRFPFFGKSRMITFHPIPLKYWWNVVWKFGIFWLFFFLSVFLSFFLSLWGQSIPLLWGSETTRLFGIRQFSEPILTWMAGNEWEFRMEMFILWPGSIDSIPSNSKNKKIKNNTSLVWEWKFFFSNSVPFHWNKTKSLGPIFDLTLVLINSFPSNSKEEEEKKQHPMFEKCWTPIGTQMNKNKWKFREKMKFICDQVHSNPFGLLFLLKTDEIFSKNLQFDTGVNRFHFFQFEKIH